MALIKVLYITKIYTLVIVLMNQHEGIGENQLSFLDLIKGEGVGVLCLKDKESIQLSTTPDPGYHLRK